MVQYFFLMIRVPPRSTLDPYTTLFQSLAVDELVRKGGVGAGELLDAAIARIEALNPTLNMVTVELSAPGTEGIFEVIADLHLYYVEGVEVHTEEDFATEAE